MLEYGIIFAIIGVVVFLGGRSLYRTLMGEKPGCACGGSGGNCPASTTPCSAPAARRKNHV